MDKLNLLKLFLAVVDRRSFSAAAASLGLAPSTVSKAMARLEESLQLQLFHRTTRQLTLTENGRLYAETARRLVMELEQLEARLRLSNDRPRGLLRINVPVSYGRCYLLPWLQAFRRRYPEITLELSFDDAYVDMIEQGIDVVIRSGTLEDSGLVARQLSPIDMLICAAPDYLERQGRPETLEAFEAHPWIRFRFRQTGRLMPIMASRAGERLNLDPGRQFIVDDGEALASLCAQGLGLTQLPHYIARDSLQRGELVPVWPSLRPAGFGVWVLYARRDYLPSRIEAFVGFLQQQLAAMDESPYATWAQELGIDPA